MNILQNIIDLIQNKQLKVERLSNYLKKNNLILFNDINSIQINSKFYYKFLYFYFDIQSKTCKNCGQKIETYSDKTFDYIITHKDIFDYCKKCYRKCSETVKNSYEKRKIKYLERYGVDHPSKCKEIQNKIKETCIKKYGENYTDIFTNKMTQSMMQKYGVKTNLQLKENKEKSKQTCLKKYGVDNFSKSKEYREFYNKRKFNRVINDPIIEPLFSQEDFEFNKILTWRCKKCGNIFQSKYDNNWKHRARCLKCFPLLNGESNCEKEIHNFLIDNNIKIEIKRRDIISPYELDIYLPDYKIAIEYDGLYWHSDECIKDPNYHLTKTNYCNNKNIQLIHIFEDEWIHKKEIVKSKILSYLNIYQTTIDSKDCIVKEIDDNQYKNFEHTNEIQFFLEADIKLGLFYHGELLSLMSFINNDNKFELLRYTEKLNTKIINGGFKLLNHFINNYNSKNIITYCDKRWIDKEIFKSLNFEYVKDISPSFWYTNCHTNQENYRFQLKENLSNYSKIWDCGKSLLRYKF